MTEPDPNSAAIVAAVQALADAEPWRPDATPSELHDRAALIREDAPGLDDPDQRQRAYTTARRVEIEALRRQAAALHDAAGRLDEKAEALNDDLAYCDEPNEHFHRLSDRRDRHSIAANALTVAAAALDRLIEAEEEAEERERALWTEQAAR